MGPLPLQLRTTVFSDGERYPLLLRDGMPLWFPTLFATTQLRHRGKASNTIAAALGSIKQLLEWSERHYVDLEARLAQGQCLKDQELDSISTYLRLRAAERDVSDIRRQKSRTLAGVHMRATKAPLQVSPATHYMRVSYVADYLQWLAIRLVEEHAQEVPPEVSKKIRQMVKALKARRPHQRKRSTSEARKGLTQEQEELLLELVAPDSKRNPFEPAVQNRNRLIVSLLLQCGMRAGELLSIKTSDIDFQTNTLLIPVRPDDPEDPRDKQPTAKTLDRRIPLKAQLADLIHDYVLHDRRAMPRARKHTFLLVTHRPGPHCGKPLSTSGLNKLFVTLKREEPERLSEFSPHSLRHTWNDRFSEWVDKKGLSEERERKMRAYLMGWSETSESATIYTRRHTQKKAMEAELRLQEIQWGKQEAR